MNSPLVNYVKLSPHKGKRTQAIDRITPHCFVGQVSVERIGAEFQKLTRIASCNYGIGVDGRVALIVDEANRSKCSSSSKNDTRAVTIECASDATAPYVFNTAVYSKLLDLCEDICRRNGKTKLIWFGVKDKTLNYKPAPDEMILTVHRWFANKSCPGDWMYQRMGNLAEAVTKRLQGVTIQPDPVQNAGTPPEKFKAYKVKITAKELNVRKGPGTAYKVSTTVKAGQVYTIVDEAQNGSSVWGKLKSGAGWISLNYTKKTLI